MNLQEQISASVRSDFLAIVRADQLDPEAIGRLMGIVDRHAFALYGLNYNYQKQLEAGIFKALVGKPMVAFNEAAVDRVAHRVDQEFRPVYLASVRAVIEGNKETVTSDQWLPIQAFLDRQFPVVQDIKGEDHE